jgi:AcrR family transcriptional regulator
MNSKKETSEQTKAHILKVAQVQFFKKGYAGSSINTIVEAANITKPTVYYHFKNKEGLFVALVEQAYENCYRHRQAAIDQSATVSEQVYQVIAADFAFCLTQPELVQFVLSLSFPLPEEEGVDLRTAHKRDYDFFQDLIERGVKSGEFCCGDIVTAALALQGVIAINIMSFLKMGHSQDFLSNERAGEIANVLLEGIAKPSEQNKAKNKKTSKKQT